MLKHLPTERELARLYAELATIGAPAIGKKYPWPYRFQLKEELIILACEMLRYDPRLLTILVIYLKEHWGELNPFALRQLFPQMKTPQVLGVLAEFITKKDSSQELKYFFNYLTQGLRPVPPQLFFFATSPLASQRTVENIKKPLSPYKKWGFLSNEAPTIDLQTKQTLIKYDYSTRQQILESLIKQQKKISIHTYLEALNFSISRQQALYDLKHCPQLKLTGQGRGASWQRKTK